MSPPLLPPLQAGFLSGGARADPCPSGTKIKEKRSLVTNSSFRKAMSRNEIIIPKLSQWWANLPVQFADWQSGSWCQMPGENFPFLCSFKYISVINSVVRESQLHLNLGGDVSAFVRELIPKRMFQNMLKTWSVFQCVSSILELQLNLCSLESRWRFDYLGRKKRKTKHFSIWYWTDFYLNGFCS